VSGHARRLARPDKWCVGVGDGLVFAPPFPQWLDAPGFWDEAHLFQYPVRPLFTVALVEAGEPLVSRAVERAWTPDALTVRHAFPGLTVVERRTALGDWTLGSEWLVRNRSARRRALHVVVWTAWPGEDLDDDGVTGADGTLALARRVRDRMGHAARLTMRLSLAPRARTVAAVRSEGALPPPRFDMTPFWDQWMERGLAGGTHLQGISPRGVVYAALERRIAAPGEGRAQFLVQARLELEGVARTAVAAGGAGRAAGAAGQRGTRGRARGRRAPADGETWSAFLAGVPTLASEPLLDWAWYNRWHGLRLNRVPPVGQYRHPSVCEGIAYFHQPIAYSAPCHARELRWAHDPTWAYGVLRTFLGMLGSDGAMHGRIYVDHLQRTDFYHGDWGAALDAVLAVHPDAAVARELYEALARYATWLVATRDAEGSGMIDVVDQYETGQEYMSRYLAVDPDADRYGWESRIRLKGIDVTVYAYRIFQALARRHDPDRPWSVLAQRTARAIREIMWDQELGMFSDVDPRTGRRTGVKAAVCFYPYLTDLVGEEHLAGLERHLFDSTEFWTPFPVPSSSRDDPRFDPDARWRGKRHNCPWNGRVWPMTNSHLVDALARVVRLDRRRWSARFARLFRRFLTMMTFGGRADRPNAFEHYHPVSGKPSLYRGIDDYQHSWLVDLIVSHVFGFTPLEGERFALDPLPIGLDRARLIDLPYRGARLRLRLTGERVHVTIDGRTAAVATVGEPLQVSL